jgi:hypothetical protein
MKYLSNFLPSRPEKLLLVAAAGALTLATTPAPAAGVQTWAESYGVGSYTAGKTSDDPFYGSGSDFPVAMAKMPDGGYVVAGQLDLPELYPLGYHTSSNAMATLVRFAPDGNILWQKLLRQTNNTNSSGTFIPAQSRVHQVATDAQGNIFICGGKGNADNSGEVPFVAKFSPSGGLVWQNGIGGASAVVGNPPQTVPLGVGSSTYMSLTNDGGVVITLSQSRPNVAYSIPVLAKFNANGALALYKAYDNQVQYLGTTPVCQSKDGSRYVMAFIYAYDGSDPGSRYGLYLLVTDAGGDIIAQRGYNHSDSGGEQPIALVATADGGFATLSTLPDYAGGILRKFNSTLSTEVLHKRITIAPGHNGHLGMNSLVQTADGGFLVGGETVNDFAVSQYDVMLMKVSSAGALQFVSVLGGPRNDGGPSSTGPSSAFAIETTDRAYGLAATSASYNTGGAVGGGAYYKPDWWMAKTDANRKVRNFNGTMVDQPLSTYSVTGSPQAAATPSEFRAPTYPYGGSTTIEPQFIIQDPGAKTPPNQPAVAIQGSSPRILGSLTAEAVVGQHFAYHILGAFFDSGKPLTYSATGLPQGFVLDTKTGIISAVAKAGSETSTPVLVALQVTDGVDTARGHLSLTIGDGLPMFTVNGSDKPSDNLADTPLQLSAQYPGTAAGRNVSVQSSTDPNNAASWVNLQTGTGGNMIVDLARDQYVLNTTGYPQKNGVYFRVRVTAPSRADVFSNVVGPFNLASSKQRAGQTLFRIARNGLRADFDFRATQVAPASGVALRVQSTTTPADEASWTDLSSSQGNISGMKADDATHFSLLTNSAGIGDGIYFRAVAAATGLVDSLSNIIGPYSLINASPPVVSIQSPTGGSDPSSPASIKQGADGTTLLTVNIKATGNRPIPTLSVAFDGEIVSTFNDITSGQLYTTSYSTDQLGDHVIEAIAIDDLGVTGRAGTGPQYIRIIPASPGGVKAEKAGEISGSGATAVRRNVFTVAKSGGNWDDSSTWQSLDGKPGVPGQFDFAIIGSATVHVDSARVFALTINGGSIVGPGNLQVDNMLTIAGGTFARVFVKIGKGAVCEAINVEDIKFGGALENEGTINIHGARGIVGVTDMINLGTINFQLPLIPSEQLARTLPLDPRTITATDFNVSGKVGQTFSGASRKPIVSPNGGAIIAPDRLALVGNAGGTLITNDGGSLITNDGGSLITNDGGSLITNDGGSLITNDGAGLITENGAGLVTDNGSGFKVDVGTKATAPNMSAATSRSGFVQTGGEMDLSNILIAGPVTLNAGVLSGSGVIAGSLTNNGGYISPGHSPGGITVTGNFSQGAKGTLVLEAAGGEAGQFDRLQVGGTAKLAGKLDLRLLNGYVPLSGEVFNPIGYKSATGTLTSSSNAKLTVNQMGIAATIDATKPNPGAGQPLNISTRMEVLSGENVLIAGFIVTGPARSTKKVLIRGLGPSLPVSGSLADPLLEFHGANGSVVTNDSWKSTQQAEILATTIPPKNEKEAAIVATIPVGSAGFTNCTAILKGAHGETGIGLVEIYDLDTASRAKLANISTRGFVDTGDNVMIGGFIVGGGEPAKVLIRAIGPSLPVAGQLHDTVLDLHDQNGSVLTNDDWRETQESDIKATTIPPTSDRESAIVATLVPGNYTAVVRGKNDTTGVALVEAYNLQ